MPRPSIARPSWVGLASRSFPMAEALQQQGLEAFADEDFSRARDLYSQALELDPSNHGLLVRRAQTHNKLGRFADALGDAQRAIELNPSLPKAFLQKGIACFSLQDYGNAKAAFEQAAKLADSSAPSWISKCDEKLLKAEIAQAPSDNARDQQAAAPEPSSSHRPVTPKYRHEWYQSDMSGEIVVTIFAKGINPDDAKIEFGEQMLSVLINVPDGEPYVLQTRLFGKVNVAQCKYTFLSTKVEIRLKKAEDVRWTALEFEKRAGVVQRAASSEPTKYPSSSKKNWDKLEAEVKREEKDEKLEGDAALNKLFREIYSNADEDTRRAMNKSFVESNGTVLSTNWSEVGGKKIEGSAPQGMEMKRWEL